MTYHCVNFPVIKNDDIILSSVTSLPHDNVVFTYTQADNMTDAYKPGALFSRSYEMIYAVMNDVFSSRCITM